MKGLTLTAPWGTLVAIGAKRVETRNWPTRYHGPLAIHQAKGLGPVGGRAGLLALCGSEPFASALTAAGYSAHLMPAWGLPQGAIVAVARLAYCVPTISEKVGAALLAGRRVNVVELGRAESALLWPERGEPTEAATNWLLDGHSIALTLRPVDRDSTISAYFDPAVPAD